MKKEKTIYGGFRNNFPAEDEFNFRCQNIDFKSVYPKSYEDGKCTMIQADEVGFFKVDMGKTKKIGKFFYLYYTKDLFWFRFFNRWGLKGKTAKRGLTFGKRNGYTKSVVLFGWRLSLLNR